MHQVPRQDWIKIYDELGFLSNGEIEAYIHLIHDRVRAHAKTLGQILCRHQPEDHIVPAGTR